MRIENLRIKFDRVIDYIPLFSLINNAINLIQKRVFASKPAPTDTYRSYLNLKKRKLCILYMIPFGRLIAKIFQLNKPKVPAYVIPEFHSSDISSSYPSDAEVESSDDEVESVMTLLGAEEESDAYTIKWKACYQWMKEYSKKTHPLLPSDLQIKVNSTNTQYLPHELIWEPVTGNFKVTIHYEDKELTLLLFSSGILLMPEHFIGCWYEPSSKIIKIDYTEKPYTPDCAFNLSVLSRMLDQLITLDLI